MSKNINAFLKETAALVKKSSGKNLGENEIFSENVQMLDGFKVGFMKPEIFTRLCGEHGLDASNAEAILMQTNQNTVPHVHLKGESSFLPLGAEHGYPASAGGTYLGAYQEGKKEFELGYVPAKQGKVFEVRSGNIHFFAPEKGATFSAIALVSPRIKQDDGSFDMRHFTEPRVAVGAMRATVCAA